MEKQNAGWTRGKCIGKGSFGTVSLAVGKSGGRAFAVKSVDQSSCVLSQLESLEREIRILRSLSFPFVVEYLGDDVTRESATTSYRNLHMEYLPGGTVADLAAGKGAVVDERVVRSFTWCVVSALRFVHSKGIVHCDVKGKNVLVGRTPGIAKLADFGSAIEISGEATGRKAALLPRGSPLWMAPEVIRGEAQGPESDVWSLGCTVIEMITGRPAWDDHGADTLCRIGFSDGLPEFPTQLSELGRDFLGKCLRREPTERWSCDQLLQHPFVASASANAINDSSPRCVLDWFNSEFSDDEEDTCSSPNCGFENHGASARDRIKELASSTGAIWESDGWEAVRTWVCDGAEAEAENCCGDEGAGTTSAYPDLIRTEEEMVGTSSEYLGWTGTTGGSGGTSLEYPNSGQSPLLERRCNNCDCSHGFGGFKAGSSCRDGSLDIDSAVKRPDLGFYSCCIILLLFHYTILRFNLLFVYSSLYILYFSSCMTSIYAYDRVTNRLHASV